MKLHRELDISQKAAWFMLHRIREAWSNVPKDDDRFAGPVEVDESYSSDKRANMSNAKRRALQEASAVRGPDGKGAVATVKDRATLKRDHKGTFHKLSPKHLDRCAGVRGQAQPPGIRNPRPDAKYRCQDSRSKPLLPRPDFRQLFPVSPMWTASLIY